MDELDELKSIKTEMAENPTEMILDQYRREIEDDKAHHQELLAQLQESMPEHQKFLSMTEDRNQIRQKIAEMERNIASFEILAKSQKDPVRIPSSVIEPTVPIKPSRVLYIGMGLIFSLGLGLGLVFLLEHVDHSVKVPEHVTHGLTLPLAGRGAPDPPNGADSSRRPPLDPRHSRLDRGRRVPQHPGQSAGRRRPSRSDRHPAGHQPQGRRRQEHRSAQPGRDLRPGR